MHSITRAHVKVLLLTLIACTVAFQFLCSPLQSYASHPPRVTHGLVRPLRATSRKQRMCGWRAFVKASVKPLREAIMEEHDGRNAGTGRVPHTYKAHKAQKTH